MVLPYHCDIEVHLEKPKSSVIMEEKYQTSYFPQSILLNVTVEDDAANETFDVLVVLTHSITGELKYITTQKASINESNWNTTHHVFVDG